MSNKLKVALLVLIVAGLGAWYAFRPERLFINQKVNEQTLKAWPPCFSLPTARKHSD